MEQFWGPIYKCQLLLEYMLFMPNYHTHLASLLITICTSLGGFNNEENKRPNAKTNYFTLKKKDSVCFSCNNFLTGVYLLYNAQSPQHECTKYTWRLGLPSCKLTHHLPNHHRIYNFFGTNQRNILFRWYISQFIVSDSYIGNRTL